jgi:hypothetical protein
LILKRQVRGALSVLARLVSFQKTSWLDFDG